MFDRRNFLKHSLALATLQSAPGILLGDQLSSHALSEGVKRLDLLGQPRSWSAFHPIHPERVVIMSEKGSDDWLGRDDRFGLAAEKFDLIRQMMRLLTDYYRVPHLFEKWVLRLAKRESLASTGIGGGFGLLHQFQDNGQVRLMNASVDWWLFLFRHGANWSAFDDRLVYGMIGHVFSSGTLRFAGKCSSGVRVDVSCRKESAGGEEQPGCLAAARTVGPSHRCS